MNLSYKNVVRPTQTHTDTIVSLESKYTQDIEISPKQLNDVDGLITNKTNIILSTRYADCTPLFFFDPVKKVIASVHSGWKGTVKKIGLKTINKMIKEYGSKPENIIVCIGPTIRGCHFEVSDDVRKMFENAFGIDEKMIKSSVDEGKYYINSVYANTKTFHEAGIKKENIIDSEICTVCSKDKFFSFRGNNKESGRMVALICLI